MEKCSQAILFSRKSHAEWSIYINYVYFPELASKPEFLRPCRISPLFLVLPQDAAHPCNFNVLVIPITGCLFVCKQLNRHDSSLQVASLSSGKLYNYLRGWYHHPSKNHPPSIKKKKSPTKCFSFFKNLHWVI